MPTANIRSIIRLISLAAAGRFDGVYTLAQTGQELALPSLSRLDDLVGSGDLLVRRLDTRQRVQVSLREQAGSGFLLNGRGHPYQLPSSPHPACRLF